MSDSARDLRPGAILVLEVAAINDTGVFLDVGTDKHLLLPRSELHEPVQRGDRVVVIVLQDARGRHYASNQITRTLDFDPWTIDPEQQVRVLVYGQNERGWLCVVDGRYYGMLFRDRTHEPLQAGDEKTAWVTAIGDDGKLDLDLRKPGVDPFHDDRSRLEARLRRDGFLALHDKSPPARIKAELGMSKKAFKRALGALYKARKVALEDDGVRWLGGQDQA